MIRRLVAAVLLIFPFTSASASADELRLVAGELPPYAFHVPPPTVAEAGEPMGLVYEVVREVAWRIGHSGTVEFRPWVHAQELASTQPNTGILPLTRSPEREDKYRWLFNVITDDLVLVGGAGVDVRDLWSVRDRPVGVLRRSGADALLHGHGFNRVQTATEEWINAQRMKDRLIDAWLAPRLMVLYAYREVGGDVSELHIGQVVRRSEIWLAASKDISDQEARRWQDGFERVRADGTYDAILARYVRLRPEPVPEGRRSVEIQWVN
ncbi:substrate-binding periplasmic protein [Skermanella pratensis]|uniref:substrate-binding periplasmic protein n=1 Tax=Skermanella pratensis TaxID=2233999 RepID=UPI0013014FD1|nr:transporter substrate-binding domain-containing protein [Skermanella pratensis]